MARKFLTPVDLTKYEILNAKAHNRTTPSGLGVGDKGLFWFNTSSNRLEVWDGAGSGLKATDSDLLQGQDGAFHLSRANHTGTQIASTISDFSAAVRVNRLDQMAAPTASVSFDGQKVTNLAAGTAGTDAATYGQLLQLINKQSFKEPVKLATTANITTLAGLLTVDGGATQEGMRVLVKDQTDGTQNGIYTASSGAWVRAADFDAADEIISGSIIPVQVGTVNADKLFMLATDGTVTPGTTSMTFFAYGAASGEVGVAGAGLIKTGSTYDVGPGLGITVGADSVSIDTSVVGRKVQGAIPTTTSGVFTVSGSTVTINHGLSNWGVNLTVRYYTSPGSGNTQGQTVEVEEYASDANNLVIVLPAAPNAAQYYVSIVG